MKRSEKGARIRHVRACTLWHTVHSSTHVCERMLQCTSHAPPASHSAVACRTIAAVAAARVNRQQRDLTRVNLLHHDSRATVWLLLVLRATSHTRARTNTQCMRTRERRMMHTIAMINPMQQTRNNAPLYTRASCHLTHTRTRISSSRTHRHTYPAAPATSGTLRPDEPTSASTHCVAQHEFMSARERA
jgi:hypothetical protein